MDTYFYGNSGTALINLDTVLNNSMRFDEQEFASEMEEMSAIFEQLANNLKHLFMRHPNIRVETGKHGVLVCNAYNSYLISSSNMMLDYIDTGSEFLNVMLVPVINSVQEDFIAGKSTQLFNMFKANRLTKDEIPKETYTNLLIDPLNRHPIDELATELQTELKKDLQTELKTDLQTELQTELKTKLVPEIVPEVTNFMPITNNELIKLPTNSISNQESDFDEDSIYKGGYGNIPRFSYKQYKLYYHELLFTKDTPTFLLESFKNLDDSFTYDTFLDYIKIMFDNVLGVDSIIQRHSDVSYVIAGDFSVSVNANKNVLNDYTQINYTQSGSISKNIRKVFSILDNYLSDLYDLSYINWHNFSNNKSLDKYFASDAEKRRIHRYAMLELQDNLVTIFKNDLSEFLHTRFPDYRRAVLKTSLGIPVFLFSLRRQDQDHYLVAVTLDDYPYVSDSVDCYLNVKDFDVSNFVNDFKNKLSQ